MVDWLTARGQARRDIHAAFAVSATYEDDVVVVPVAISCRWHNKQQIVGNISGGDYAEIVSTIQHLIFSSEELTAKSLTLKHGGVVKLIDLGNYELELDAREPPDGPINVKWTVVRP